MIKRLKNLSFADKGNSVLTNAFSYRGDQSVPSFDDGFSIAVMDGECALCSFGARMIARFDHSMRIRICPVQTDLGTALLTHYGLDPGDPESWLFIEDGTCWTGFEAWIMAGQRCGGIGNLMRIFWLLPGPIRAWIYRRIARNRIALFGRADMCTLPDPRLKDRLIGGL